ncbi:hypothetical protein ANN_02593 [Periplaneta americana]|uniref:Uncharacterized protein n=1 Tax=Periplaneta americana TaxID=6978 RepID=A0ABQ8TWQ7_PERAM|nr:hypothetical protein ANN_02593 [Periplaneta americana]
MVPISIYSSSARFRAMASPILPLHSSLSLAATFQFRNRSKLRTGNVASEPRSGRPSMPEHIAERIREAIERSSQASSRRLSNQLDMPGLKVLKFTPKNQAYNI